MSGIASSVLRAMADAGASTEVILAAIEAQAVVDAERLAEQRAGNAERQQRFRDRRSKRRNGSNALRDVTPPIEEIIPPVSSDEETSAPAEKPKKAGPGKPDGVSDPTWRDFQAHRRAKKAPISETALSAIRREAAAVGWTMEAALTEIVARDWRGFKAQWVTADQAKNGRSHANDGSSYLDHLLAKTGAAR